MNNSRFEIPHILTSFDSGLLKEQTKSLPDEADFDINICNEDNDLSTLLQGSSLIFIQEIVDNQKLYDKTDISTQVW